MKSNYLIKFNTGKVDENGFPIHEFAVTKRKYANAKEARKRLEKIFECPLDKTWVEDITPCGKDWLKSK